MDLVPELWSGKKNLLLDTESSSSDDDAQGTVRIDAMLHMGMNFEDYYQVEPYARRDGFDWVGDDGLPLPKRNGGIGGRWQGLPTMLTPFFDVNEIVARIKDDLPDVRAELSEDAGRMYCEFLFYTSLA
jgi:pyroglutamyl-peptidase